MRAKLKAIAALFLLAIAMPPAQATFHLMKVVEVFPGTAAAPNAQYVVIQMYSPGQNLVGGHPVIVYNAAGTAVATFTFAGNVANGANQARILIATTQAQSFFGVTANLIMSPSLLSAGGKVCFDAIDCVAWGAYTGSATGVGTPFNAAGGLQSGRAAIRRLNIAGAPSTLDAGDDTNDCATDFVFGLPAPRNNAGVLGVVPAATCGNGALEGLEQCDDHNLANGDGCSSTCAVEAAAAPGLSISNAAVAEGNSGTKAAVFTVTLSRASASAVTYAIATANGSAVAGSDYTAASLAAQSIPAGQTSKTFAVTIMGDTIPEPNETFAVNVSNVAGAAVADGTAVGTILNDDITARRSDFNGDGMSDILWRNSTTGSNSYWRSGNYATQQVVTAIPNTSWVVAGAGDFNGDAKSDILWHNDASGANAVWFSANSATAQNLATVTDLQWKIAGVGDFDGDGRSDILWRNGTSGSNSYWRSGNFATPQSVTAIPNTAWIVSGVGDFNGDGKSDILWHHNASGANALWYSANSATAQNLTTVTNLQWKIAGVGDFDGDGRSDILWRNGTTGGNSYWRSGNYATQGVVRAITDVAWVAATVGDYNGDSRSDVVWRHTSTGGNALWYSANSATAQNLTTVTNLQWKIVP